MKRRHFLTRTVKGVAAASVVGSALSAPASPAVGQGLRRLKMITTWPKNFPGLGTGAQRLADSITQLSGGKLEVKVFSAGELVPPSETFDAVSGGAADCYHAIEYYFQHRSRALNFFASVPFGMTAGEMAAWVYHGGGQALWDEVSGNFNIKPFQVGNTGAQMGGWFNRDINTIEDFKGLKIRIPGLGGDVLARVGAIPQPLSGGQIFSALQSGKLDATEWAGPWGDLELGLHRVAKNYYYPGFYEPGTALSAGFNRKLWDSLEDDLKAVVTQAAMAENALSRAEFQSKNADALFTLRQVHKVTMRRFPDGVMKAIGEASGDVVRSVGTGGDALTRRVFEDFRKFRSKSLSWSHLGEQSFRNARILPFEY
ncbi:MAG: TRAP transporter substrate-binding protein [Rhodospirillales bacterium]|nr:TRAP transporter substrate-binding protein [Alphaproteobacteria bacterium]MBL6947763.1 TRAP transporter substrate-binding protein [Rhodospirillales bacterium]